MPAARHIIGRAFLLSVVLVLPGVHIVGAQAADLAVIEPAARDQLLVEMDELLAMPLADFLAAREELAARPGPAVYDWSSDGCTSPVPALRSAFAARFERFAPACVRHDWGYRNFGSVNIRGFDATEDRRWSVDERMRADMLEICEQEEPTSIRCRIEAELVHRAVRVAGHLSFYGFFE